MKSFLSYTAYSMLALNILSAEPIDRLGFKSLSLLQDPVPGTITGTIDFALGQATLIAIDGTTLGVFDNTQGKVSFFDITNPQAPYGSVSIDDQASQMSISGTLCAIAAGLHLGDVYMINTQTLSNFALPYGAIYGIAFQGGVNGAADGYSSGAALAFIDQVGGVVLSPQSLNSTYPWLIGLNGTTGIAESWTGSTPNSQAKFQIFDIQAAQLLDSYSVDYENNVAPYNVAVSGTLSVQTFIEKAVFVHLDTMGSTTLLMNTPGQVALNGTLAVAAYPFTNIISIFSESGLIGTLTSGDGPTSPVFLNATTCYIANQISNNITILDLTNPQAPVIEGTITLGPPYGDVSIFTASYGTCGASLDSTHNNVILFDTDTKSISKIVFAPNNTHYTGNVALYGTTGVIGCSGGMQFFDAQTGLTTGFMSYPDSAIYGVALNGTLGAALQIEILTTPSPVSISFFDAASQTVLGSISNFYQSAVNDKGLITLEGTCGLFSLHLTRMIGLYDASTQQLLGTYSNGFMPWGVALSGTSGIIGYDDSDIFSVSVFDTSVKAYAGTIFVGQSPAFASAVGDYALVSCNWQDSIVLIDIPNQSVLGSITNLNKPGQVQIYNSDINLLKDELTIQGFFPYDSENEIIFCDFAFYVPPQPGPTEGFAYATGNAGEILRMFEELDGHTNSGLQGVISTTKTEPAPIQIDDASTYAPALKLLQFSQEKLDLLLHKELDDCLYSLDKGTLPFIIGGYELLSQNTRYPYNGYKTESFYQLIGLTHSFSHMNSLISLGVSESRLKVKPQKAHASYITVYGSLGLKGELNNWNLGLKGLYGYSFTKSSRTIPSLNEKAYSDHNMWNASAHLKLSYTKKAGRYHLSPYEEIGYLYGKEQNFTESGATFMNLNVKDETVSLIRNLLGLNFDVELSRHACFLIDGSWVYENYLKDNHYKAAFINTDVWGSFKQTEPNLNYGRVKTGFKGTSGKLGWELVFTGLYSSYLSDNAVSLKFDYQF
jgi:hypothetical protein